MKNHNFTTQLADIHWDQDFNVPLELLINWNASDKTAKTHGALLAPFYTRGTVVSSDTSGFTKLSEEHHVLAVTYFIHEPKEIIYAMGRAIGGEAIGVWEADNTAMFYAEYIDLELIIEQMARAQHLINETCRVRVGIGIYNQKFLKVAKRFAGKAYELIDGITEDDISAKELAVIAPGKRKMAYLENYVSGKKEILEGTPVWSLGYHNLGADAIIGTDVAYPAPFSAGFIHLLKNTNLSNPVHLDKICAELETERQVCFIKVHLPKTMLLLSRLTFEAMISDLFRRCIEPFALEVARNTGQLFVILTSDLHPLIEFLKLFGGEIKKAGFVFSAGIAKSLILMEHYGTKSNMISGMGINIASKLAEDVGEAHTLLVHESAGKPTGDSTVFTFSKPVSHITLSGWGIRIA
ncbi:MAG: hypothetical protein M3O71_25510 [Bacteroidota bacterium]|nr:hypothetical protein [Bacteroidota bacterium]